MKFEYLVLGIGLNKTKNGFSGEGDWDLYKCFVNNPRGYGEFYINLNRRTGEGEIRFKDTEYADFLTKEFEAEMKGYLDEIERLDKEAEEWDKPAYIRKGIKIDD